MKQGVNVPRVGVSCVIHEGRVGHYIDKCITNCKWKEFTRHKNNYAEVIVWVVDWLQMVMCLFAFLCM